MVSPPESAKLPFSSASLTTYRAARSLTDPPGFINSTKSTDRIWCAYQLFHRCCIPFAEKADSAESTGYCQLHRQTHLPAEERLSRSSELELDALSAVKLLNRRDCGFFEPFLFVKRQAVGSMACFDFSAVTAGPSRPLISARIDARPPEL
jgi:hypothetical protein